MFKLIISKVIQSCANGGPLTLLGNCKRCLSIYQKHDNVVQYKESQCMMDHMRNYNDLCRSISVDEPLKTLFRVNGESWWWKYSLNVIIITAGRGVACPIAGTYSFSYSRGQGLCSYPLSSLHQCSGYNNYYYHVKLFSNTEIFVSESLLDFPFKVLECLRWKHIRLELKLNLSEFPQA